MADHFADQYWSGLFWTAKYFQGGEQNPGAISASLSGSGAIVAELDGIQNTGDLAASLSGGGSASAVLTSIGTEIPSAITGGGKRRKRARKSWPGKMVLLANLRASVSGNGAITATADAKAIMAAKLNGQGNVDANLSAQNLFLSTDIEFWLMAA